MQGNKEVVDYLDNKLIHSFVEDDKYYFFTYHLPQNFPQNYELTYYLIHNFLIPLHNFPMGNVSIITYYKFFISSYLAIGHEDGSR